MENRIRIPSRGRETQLLPMGGKDKDGNLYEVDNLGFLRNGKRFLPIMGEFHYARFEPEDWEKALLKMRAGGVNIVSTYVFWIHHEEREGEWDFSGSRNLRGFLQICRELNFPVWLRIGPWCHGECRHGGFPDWVQHSERFAPRSNDPGYLVVVKRLYEKIAEQSKGMLWKDGGPILGIQLENEFGHCGGTTDPVEGKAHMSVLKKMAVEAGFEVPYYTATGWNGSHVVENEMLPVLGGYVDAPWEPGTYEIPASENFLFTPYRNDEHIGSDWNRDGAKREMFNTQCNPYLTAELGAGLQVTSHRRTYPWPEDVEANALTMLGAGAGLLGYYMYHGGINPDGRYTSLNETQSIGGYTTLPTKSYDAQTCIRQSGEINVSYGKLKKLHLLTTGFGELLAGAEACFPEIKPASAEDMTTLRCTVRMNREKGVGFLFLNNHQRKRKMADHEDFSVEVSFCDRLIELPHLTVRSGKCGIIPFNLPLEDAVLRRTNAWLLCKLGRRTFFYSDLEKPFFDWDKESSWVTVLTPEQADRAYLLKDGLYITENASSCLYENKGKKYLITQTQTETVTVYREKGDVELLTFTCEGVRVAASVASADEKTDDAGKVLYRDYYIAIDPVPEKAIEQLYLCVDYRGDRAEVYRDGKLIDDWYTTGETWRMSLKRFGYPKELMIRIYSSDNLIPCTFGNEVYYDLPVEKGCRIDKIETAAEYEISME